MKKNPHKVNYFLIIYLILYLSISMIGNLFMSASVQERVAQFLPLVLGILYLIVTKQSISSSTRLKSFHPLTILLIIPFTYCLWPLISIVNMISLLFSDNVISNTITNTVITNGFVYSILTMALLPAVIEEFTFRGVLYGQYRNQRPVKAIFLSAFCFGLMHMNFNQFCYAFVLGTIFALLVEASGSLFASIIMHFLFNATSIFMVFIEQKLKNLLPDVYGNVADTSLTIHDVVTVLPALLPIAVGGCLLAYLLYRKIAKLNGNWPEIQSWRDKESYQLRPNYKLTGISFYAFTIICLFMCVLIEVIK